MVGRVIQEPPEPPPLTYVPDDAPAAEKAKHQRDVEARDAANDKVSLYVTLHGEHTKLQSDLADWINTNLVSLADRYDDPDLTRFTAAVKDRAGELARTAGLADPGGPAKPRGEERPERRETPGGHAPAPSSGGGGHGGGGGGSAPEPERRLEAENKLVAEGRWVEDGARIESLGPHLVQGDVPDGQQWVPETPPETPPEIPPVDPAPAPPPPPVDPAPAPPPAAPTTPPLAATAAATGTGPTWVSAEAEHQWQDAPGQRYDGFAWEDAAARPAAEQRQDGVIMGWVGPDD